MDLLWIFSPVRTYFLEHLSKNLGAARKQSQKHLGLELAIYFIARLVIGKQSGVIFTKILDASHGLVEPGKVVEEILKLLVPFGWIELGKSSVQHVPCLFAPLGCECVAQNCGLQLIDEDISERP